MLCDVSNVGTTAVVDDNPQLAWALVTTLSNKIQPIIHILCSRCHVMNALALNFTREVRAMHGCFEIT